MMNTIKYLREEAEAIAGSWNGSDEKFIDHTGTMRTDNEAQAASDLIKKLEEVDELSEYLNL